MASMPHLATVRKLVYVKIAANHYRAPRVVGARFFAATGAVTSGGTISAAGSHTVWFAITAEKNLSALGTGKSNSAAGNVIGSVAMETALPNPIVRAFNPAKGKVAVYAGRYFANVKVTNHF